MTTIAVINESTVVGDAALRPIVRALQKQLTLDVYPAWGRTALLWFVPKGVTPPAKAWWLAVLDDSDQAGALGYHDVGPEGQPLGKVFAKSDLVYGVQLSVTLSHEIVEMLCDPWVNALIQDASGSPFWFFEACDACERDEQGYDIDGVQVSDFVLPAYFQPLRNAVGPFDFRQHLREPVPALLPGGYMAYYDPRTGQWGQVTASHTPGEAFRARPHPGSRRALRMLNRADWITSTRESDPQQRGVEAP